MSPRLNDASKDPRAPSGRFADDLVGLDPDDPEAQAFAAHLDRVQRFRAGCTVEGYLADVGDFADSANRAAGMRRALAVVVVGLLLVGVGVTVWNAVGFMLATLF
ncbi:MAG: hypothetical protein ABI181_06435 [Mycobacteriaceae bacterium]